MKFLQIHWLKLNARCLAIGQDKVQSNDNKFSQVKSEKVHKITKLKRDL